MKKGIYFLILLTIHLLSCGGADPAQVLYDKAVALEGEGKIIEALNTYDKLMDYEGTEIFLKAEKELLDRGISIGICITSWTIQEMVRMENDIIRIRTEANEFPPVEEIPPRKDGWGADLIVTYKPKEHIHFQIYSPGPDQVNQTSDDIILGYSKRMSGEEEVVVSEKKKSRREISMGLDDLKKIKKVMANDDEIVLSLPEIAQFQDGSNKIQEAKMDLNDLLSKNKDKESGK